jgi:dTDP-4-amino-4,6-dideoxygalactose transaminase
MRVPFNDLARQTAAFAPALEAAFGRVLARGRFLMGPELEAFEAAFAEACGTRRALGVGNGTDALELALRALALEPGARVATVANAGMYGAAAILAAGLTPVFVDVHPDSATMDLDALKAVLERGCSAILVTHLYGRLADMARIAPLAQAGGAALIEDCAQAHGAARDGRQAGSWGVAGCFSFYPTKNLGALGDGGAVVTSDEAFAERLRRLRQYGWGRKYVAELAGGRNSRLDELQAAFLHIKLPRLGELNERRRVVARRYNAAFAGLGLGLPPEPAADDVTHLYVLRSRRRDELAAALAARGVGTETHYPVPDHRQPAIEQAMGPQPALPATEQLCAESLSLPCFPELTDAEVTHVIAAVKAAARALD